MINKKARIGSVMTLFVVSLAVVLFLVIFSFAAGGFSSNKLGTLEEKGFSVDEDLRPLLLKQIDLDGQDITLSDLIVLHSFEGTHEERIKEEISGSLSLSYGICYSFKIQSGDTVLEERWTNTGVKETNILLPNDIEFKFKNLYNKCLSEKKLIVACDAQCK